MNVVTIPSLIKGATIMDFMISDKGQNIDYSVEDMIGIVAAYISRGYYFGEIEERLREMMSPELAMRAHQIYDLFQDEGGKGLWQKGPAMDDVVFTQPKLCQFYPHVRMDMERPVDVDNRWQREFGAANQLTS